MTPAFSNIQMPLSAFLENQVSTVLHPKVPPISSTEHKVWKGVTSPFCLFKCVANGASYSFYTSFARCEIQEEKHRCSRAFVFFWGGNL